MNQAQILIVDSQKGALADISRFLQQEKYTCHAVYDEAEALTQITCHTPDLIVMDDFMPQLMWVVHRREGSGGRDFAFIPMLMAVTTQDRQTLRRGLQSGINDFLPMPITRDDLLAHVQFFLGLRDACALPEMAWLQLFCRLETLWTSDLQMEEMLDEALMWITKTARAERGSIIFLNEWQNVEQNVIVQRDISSWLLDLVNEVSSSGLAAWVAQNKEGTVVEDTERDPRWLHFPEDPLPVGSAIAVPLIFQDYTVGVLSLVHPEVGFFNGEQIVPLEAVARQMVYAVSGEKGAE